jgi:hypothetical protein
MPGPQVNLGIMQEDEVADRERGEQQGAPMGEQADRDRESWLAPLPCRPREDQRRHGQHPDEVAPPPVHPERARSLEREIARQRDHARAYGGRDNGAPQGGRDQPDQVVEPGQPRVDLRPVPKRQQRKNHGGRVTEGDGDFHPDGLRGIRRPARLGGAR